jgi:probable rRNA maturation factor
LKIRFNYAIPGVRVRSALQHRKWLSAVLLSEGYSRGFIGFIFTDDRDILRINNEFLKHNYFTDVITFDYSESGHISGEIYISVETVRKNAYAYRVSTDIELRRVMVHGILHICGYRDSSDEEKRVMSEREEHYLKVFSDEFYI